MIKFDVRNRWSGDVQFTAEIACEMSEATTIKLGLAVSWAVKTGANLNGTNLAGADLNGANLNGANLNGANLNRANLYRANLNGANLNGTNLDGTDLYKANLDGTNLNRANLYRANLNRASLNGASLNRANLDGANLNRVNLNRADLSGANLYRADLSGADLSGANLDGTNLDGANGINDFIKCIQLESYPITYTSDILHIGCERYSITEWADFSNAQIAQMDGKKALKWWRMAANNGDAAAQFNLGALYANGLGSTPVKTCEAVHWLQRSEKNGFEQAHNALSQMKSSVDFAKCK